MTSQGVSILERSYADREQFVPKMLQITRANRYSKQVNLQLVHWKPLGGLCSVLLAFCVASLDWVMINDDGNAPETGNGDV